MSYCIGPFDLFDIIFIKQRNNYRLYINNNNNNSRIILRTPLMNIPFGVEKYKYKDILNLEFSNVNTNKMYNFLTAIKQIDNFFINIMTNDIKYKIKNKLPYNLLENIKGKSYVSCIKYRKNFDSLFRTHLRKTKNNIKSIFKDTDDRLLNIMDLKTNNGNFNIELESLWISNDSYGIIYYINEGVII